MQVEYPCRPAHVMFNLGKHCSCLIELNPMISRKLWQEAFSQSQVLQLVNKYKKSTPSYCVNPLATNRDLCLSTLPFDPYLTL